MSARFYFTTTARDVSPSFDANWEQTGQAITGKMFYKYDPYVPTSVSLSGTIPITTTQDILGYQGVSKPLHAQTIQGTLNLVVNQTNQGASTNQGSLAVNVYVVSNDGTVVRGILYSAFSIDTNFPVATASTRIVSLGTITSQTLQEGDRIVVEIGAHAAAPSVGGSYTILASSNQKQDSPLTTANQTIGNSWIEFSQDICEKGNFEGAYPRIRVGDGMSRSEGAT